MQLQNTYYAIKTKSGKYVSVVDGFGAISFFEEDIDAYNLQHITHEHIEDANYLIDLLEGNELIQPKMIVDSEFEVDKIVELHINYEVIVNEFA